MLALADGAYETQGGGPEAPRAETNRYPQKFRIAIVEFLMADRLFLRKNTMSDVDSYDLSSGIAAFPIKLARAPLIAAFSLQFRNQRTTRLTDFPVLYLFGGVDIVDVADAR